MKSSLRIINMGICSLAFLTVVGCSNSQNQSISDTVNNTNKEYINPVNKTSLNPTPNKSSVISNVDSYDLITHTNGWGFVFHPGSLIQGDSLLRTTDGGIAWTPSSPPVRQNSIYAGGLAIDSNTVWIVTSSSSNTAIWHTTDGAKVWSSTIIPKSYNSATLSFVDESNGWLLVSPTSATGQEPVELYYTSDGGNAWTQILNKSETAKMQVGLKTGITFINRNTGWITVDSGRHLGQVEIYITRDGGHSWSPQHVDVPSNLLNSYGHPEPPFFASSQCGVLPVRFAGKGTVFYTTHDGGITWSPTSTVPVNTLVSVKLPHVQTIWATDGKNIVMTHDGGKQWASWSEPQYSKDRIVDINIIDSVSVIMFIIKDEKMQSVRLISDDDKIVQK